MQIFRVVSLVDITNPHCARSETDPLKIGQQANFNSLLQAIGLRSNIEWQNDPKFYSGRLPLPLEGSANHWIWEFETERDDVFLKGSDPVGHLVDDVNGVPIVDDLENSIEISPKIFQTQGEDINIHFELLN